MATVTLPDGSEPTRTQYVKVLVELGMTKEYAEFTYAMEHGEVDGDVIEVAEPAEDGQSDGDQ